MNYSYSLLQFLGEKSFCTFLFRHSLTIQSFPVFRDLVFSSTSCIRLIGSFLGVFLGLVGDIIELLLSGSVLE